MRKLGGGRLSSAHAIAIAALFVALGGSAWAVSAGSVGTKELKRNAVTSAKIKRAAVKANKIADGGVTAAKLAPDSVDSAKIVDGSITGGDIGDAQVGTNKIADAAVTTAKIADNAVTTNKIADNAVTTTKIADQAVTNGKLGGDSVTSDKIVSGQVRASDLGAIITVQQTNQIPNNTNGTTDAACPAGSVVVSGGGFSGSFLMTLRTSTRQGNGWRTEARNTTGVGQPLTAQAFCLVG